MIPFSTALINGEKTLVRGLEFIIKAPVGVEGQEDCFFAFCPADGTRGFGDICHKAPCSGAHVLNIRTRELYTERTWKMFLMNKPTKILDPFRNLTTTNVHGTNKDTYAANLLARGDLKLGLSNAHMRLDAHDFTSSLDAKDNPLVETTVEMAVRRKAEKKARAEQEEEDERDSH